MPTNKSVEMDRVRLNRAIYQDNAGQDFLEPRLWDYLRLRLQNIFRKATGEEQAVLIVEPLVRFGSTTAAIAKAEEPQRPSTASAADPICEKCASSAERPVPAICTCGEHPTLQPLGDDHIMDLIRECFPWQDEAKMNDLLTREKHVPLFPQASYDVPSYRAIRFVRAVEAKLQANLVATK